MSRQKVDWMHQRAAVIRRNQDIEKMSTNWGSDISFTNRSDWWMH
jgi:hypothetical protein